MPLDFEASLHNNRRQQFCRKLPYLLSRRIACWCVDELDFRNIRARDGSWNLWPLLFG